MLPRRLRSLLYLTPDLLGPPGGIARYCRMVTQSLTDEGAEMHVLALHDQPSSSPPASPASYTACGSSRGAFVARSTLRLLRVRPAVLLVGHLHFAPLAAALCKATRTPYIVFLYGIEAWAPLSPARRRALADANRLIAISHYTAARAAEVNHLNNQDIQVLYNCLDPALAAAMPRPDSTSPSILTVSRLSREDNYKGLDIALHAVARLKDAFPELTYHIVGDGNARPALETLARALQIDDLVRFHGRVSDEELRQLYAGSDLFVMPSREEGFGFVFLEAMAQGTPAIGGNIDATPEVIEHGVTGLTIDPRSPDAVAAAVARLLRDEKLRTRMGEAAAQRAREVFGYPAFRARLGGALETLGSQEARNTA